jgi:hypothetical protein
MLNKGCIQNYYACCYILVKNRKRDFARAFLLNFLENLSASEDHFTVPQYSKVADIVINDYDKLLLYLENNINETYYLTFKGFRFSDYPFSEKFTVCEGDLRIETIFEKHFLCTLTYTNNGSMILGISCPTMEPLKTIEEYYFDNLKKFAQSNVGYITYEQPAPFEEDRFITISEKWKANNSYYENI